MRSFVASTRSRPDLRAEAVRLEIAREAAGAVADACLAAIVARRWSGTPSANQAYLLAVQVKSLESDLGAISEASFAEDRIRAMAQAAHHVVGLARADVAAGLAPRISRVIDWQLLDGGMDDALVPVFALIVA